MKIESIKEKKNLEKRYLDKYHYTNKIKNCNINNYCKIYLLLEMKNKEYKNKKFNK